MRKTLKFRYVENPSAVFWISGPDANRFLGGQFTQELRILAGTVAYGLWLNQKGKVIGESEVARISEQEHVVVSVFSEPDVIRRRLEDFLIADEVDIADRSAEWRVLTLWDAGAAALVEEWCPGIGVGARFGLKDGAFVLPERGGSNGRFLVVAPAGTAGLWRERLTAAGAIEEPAVGYERDRIKAGIPAVPADIGPTDLPNEGGLENVGISYTKGCYLGQEVMARLKNLGQVRRRLCRIRGAGPAPAPGTALFQQGRRVGETRTAAADTEGWLGFAMVSLVAWQPDQPACLGEGGPGVEIERPG